MGIFTAEETQLSGRRAIRLSFKRNAYDRTPWLLNLIVHTQLHGYQRFPAAYEFIEETSDRPWPLIRVVAAPGVSIYVQNVPRTYIAGQETPALDFYRVQDPELVPPMAHDVGPSGLTGREEINPVPSFSILATAGPDVFPENYFRVVRLPYQVEIEHPFSRTSLSLKVPQVTHDPSDRRDARARFCYEFNPEGVLGHADNPLLRIVKTPEVELGMSEVARFGRRRPREFLGFYEIFEVDDINRVPPQGHPITPGPDWREVSWLDRVPPLAEELATAAFDVGVGFIPIVGDIVDIVELVYGIAAGRDRWGRRLTTGDLVIMGVGALLPFVGSAALRNGARLLRRFGRRAQSVEALIEYLGRASLSADEANLVREMETLIRSGRQPTPDMYRRFSELLRRVRGDYPGIEAFLNAERTGFTHATLQEAYQNYRGRLVRRGERPASPQEWAIRQTTGVPRRILEALLGPEYARGIRSVPRPRFVNVGDIPRPPGLSDDQIRDRLGLLARESARLTERLGSLSAQRLTGGVIARHLARVRINSGHFRILKGNLGELLSIPIQRSVLREISSRVHGARLISGVRMRIVTEEGQLARSVLFTDNIVAVERGGNLHIAAVFEVKSSYEGNLDGQRQIFRWIEDRISTGSQLVLPRGTRVLAADGTETVLVRERSFTYSPAASGSGRVIGLTSAERHLIAGRGSSHLGIDSPDQVASAVTRHSLDESSAEMDYLAGRFIAESSW